MLVSPGTWLLLSASVTFVSTANAACLCRASCSTNDPTTSTTSPTPTTTTTTTSTSTSAPPACTESPTNGALIGVDFECGTPTPFITETFDLGLTIDTLSPGLTGNHSVQARYTSPSTCPNGSCPNGVNARLTHPSVPVVPGEQYKLTFATWMGADTTGFIGVPLNGRGVTVSASDFSRSNWHFSQVPYHALPADGASLDLIFEWVGGTGPEARIDTVTLAPVGAYCGPSLPPLGLLLDGEFECGLGAWTQTISAGTGIAAGPAGAEDDDTSDPASGQWAWKATLAEDADPVTGWARIESAAMQVTPGRTYMLAFTTWFDRTDIGFLAASIGGSTVHMRGPGDAAQGTPRWFAPNQVFWTAPVGVTETRVVLEAVLARRGAAMAVASVVFVEVATGEVTAV